MDDLISREEAKKTLKMLIPGLKWSAIDWMVDGIPSAQQEVIRCKDCKWFNKIGCAIKIVDDSDRPSENDFCSFAERKDNG